MNIADDFYHHQLIAMMIQENHMHTYWNKPAGLFKWSNNVITNIITAYATTIETTLKNPETTRHFYEKLSSIIKTFKTR